MEINKENSKLSEQLEDNNQDGFNKILSELNQAYQEWQLQEIENMIYDCNGYLEAVDLLTKIKSNITEKFYYPVDEIQTNLLYKFYYKQISAEDLNENLKYYKRFKKEMEAINGR
jgi:hypothetical protein